MISIQRLFHEEEVLGLLVRGQRSLRLGIAVRHEKLGNTFGNSEISDAAKSLRQR
jgi:hypothetical protein